MAPKAKATLSVRASPKARNLSSSPMPKARASAALSTATPSRHVLAPEGATFSFPTSNARARPFSSSPVPRNLHASPSVVDSGYVGQGSIGEPQAEPSPFRISSQTVAEILQNDFDTGIQVEDDDLFGAIQVEEAPSAGVPRTLHINVITFAGESAGKFAVEATDTVNQLKIELARLYNADVWQLRLNDAESVLEDRLQWIDVVKTAAEMTVMLAIDTTAPPPFHGGLTEAFAEDDVLAPIRETWPDVAAAEAELQAILLSLEGLTEDELYQEILNTEEKLLQGQESRQESEAASRAELSKIHTEVRTLQQSARELQAMQHDSESQFKRMDSDIEKLKKQIVAARRGVQATEFSFNKARKQHAARTAARHQHDEHARSSAAQKQKYLDIIDGLNQSGAHIQEFEQEKRELIAMQKQTATKTLDESEVEFRALKDRQAKLHQELSEIKNAQELERMLEEERKEEGFERVVLEEIAGIEEITDIIEGKCQRCIDVLRDALLSIAGKETDMLRHKAQMEEWLQSMWSKICQQKQEQVLLHQRMQEDELESSRLQKRTDQLVEEVIELEERFQEIFYEFGGPYPDEENLDEETRSDLELIRQKRSAAQHDLAYHLSRRRRLDEAMDRYRREHRELKKQLPESEEALLDRYVNRKEDVEVKAEEPLHDHHAKTVGDVGFESEKAHSDRPARKNPFLDRYAKRKEDVKVEPEKAPPNCPAKKQDDVGIESEEALLDRYARRNNDTGVESAKALLDCPARKKEDYGGESEEALLVRYARRNKDIGVDSENTLLDCPARRKENCGFDSEEALVDRYARRNKDVGVESKETILEHYSRRNKDVGAESENAPLDCPARRKEDVGVESEKALLDRYARRKEDLRIEPDKAPLDHTATKKEDVGDALEEALLDRYVKRKEEAVLEEVNSEEALLDRYFRRKKSD